MVLLWGFIVRIKYLIFLSLLMCLTLRAETTLNAPLGLQWGDSGKDLVQKYAAEESKEHSELSLYKINKPPISLKDIDEVYGAVDKKYGLVRVILITNFLNDEYGLDGLELYKKYKKILTEKYGAPESYEFISRKVYTSKDEFYECLRYKGCGGYSSFFLSDDNPAGLYITLVGFERGEGELRIFYESPDLKKAEREDDESSIDKAKTGL